MWHELDSGANGGRVPAGPNSFASLKTTKTKKVARQFCEPRLAPQRRARIWATANSLNSTPAQSLFCQALVHEGDEIFFHLVVFGAIDIHHVSRIVSAIRNILARLRVEVQMIHGPVGRGKRSGEIIVAF